MVIAVACLRVAGQCPSAPLSFCDPLWLQAVADGECRKASDMAEAHYSSVFNKEVCPEERELAAEHQVCGILMFAEDRTLSQHMQTQYICCMAVNSLGSRSRALN